MATSNTTPKVPVVSTRGRKPLTEAEKTARAAMTKEQKAAEKQMNAKKAFRAAVTTLVPRVEDLLGRLGKAAARGGWNDNHKAAVLGTLGLSFERLERSFIPGGVKTGFNLPE